MRNEPHRRRVSVARYEHDRARALADPALTNAKRLRLTYEGAGLSTAALAILSNVSRESIRKAERGDPVSLATLRRLAAALNVSVSDLRP